jgi:L,D-peptidoglycan transpeptidase YkuD (ErfK/YbiS/YcfS/YnhG family)
MPIWRLPRLPWRWLRAGDGWSDDAGDQAYNRPVSHPHRFSAERLWRDDHAYDIVVILGHNDCPPRVPLGSAIFLHIARPGLAPTEGCIALPERELRALLAQGLRGFQVG